MREFKKRIEELQQLGIEGIGFQRSKKINEVRVLGKGHVGIVVLCYTKKNIDAMKIRRLDADRDTMIHEGEMLKLANRNEVGPQLFGLTNNFILMEYIEGDYLPEYIVNNMKRKKQVTIKRTLRRLLFDCFKMDIKNLDHGELSNAARHIIIKKCGKPVIIDFESSSILRKPKNVQSMCNYLFISSNISAKIKKLLGIDDIIPLINALREYKKIQCKNLFDNILIILGLTK